jgi:hypothetical protein
LEPLVPFPLTSPARFSRSIKSLVELGATYTRMPLGQYQDIPRAFPRDGSALGFDIV